MLFNNPPTSLKSCRSCVVLLSSMNIETELQFLSTLHLDMIFIYLLFALRNKQHKKKMQTKRVLDWGFFESFITTQQVTCVIHSLKQDLLIFIQILS
jgi:hypothetical protein